MKLNPRTILKGIIIAFVVFASSKLMAQTPEGINYQAVIRKTNGALVTNTTIAIRIQIKQNSSTGTVVYAERQSVITSPYGLVNFVIGQGTILSGTFSAINWSTGNYWVSLAVDFVNGTNYLDYGSQRLMSAPYALYAKTAGVQLNQWRYGATAPAAALGSMGDFYLNTATGDVHYKSAASTWTLTGNIKGPQGNAGAAGATGATGLTGATGVAGPAGVAGPQGPAGATGPAGPVGLTGATGVAGPQGPAGATGTTGLTGAAGPQGPAGSTGATGLTGATGPQGAAGTNGNAVLNGATAPNHNQGVNGDFYINTATNTISGPKANGAWPAGVSLVGPQGPTGAAGATGPQGVAGAVGPQGTAGATGLTGAVGAVGPQGPAGATGSTGAVGPQGPQGLAGLLASGSAVGNTPYWDGNQWVLNSSNIYNNGTSVGIGTVSPNASAALEVNSTTKGILLPTMTQTQRNAISTPATGLLIYQSDNTPGFYYYNGSAWTAIAGAAAGGGGAAGYSSTANTLIYTTDGF